MIVHFCPLDPECRRYGAPWRLHIDTDRRHVAIALTPGARFANADGSTTWMELHRRY